MFHAHTIRAYACMLVCVYVAACAQQTHSDRRDYEVGLRGEHISFLVIINATKNVAKTCSAFGKYIPRCAVQRRSAPALSIAIYSFILFLHPLSLSRSPSLFPSSSLSCLFTFSSCCSRFFLHLLPFPPPHPLLLPLLVLRLDHRRCCQTTCTLRPGQLPSCGHPFPSFSLSPSWVNPPPSAHNSLSLSPLVPLILQQTLLPLILPPLSISSLAAPRLPFSSFLASSSRLSVTVLLLASFPQASYCYYFRGYRTYPFLPAMMQRFINFRDANRR